MLGERERGKLITALTNEVVASGECASWDDDSQVRMVRGEEGGGN